MEDPVGMKQKKKDSTFDGFFPQSLQKLKAACTNKDKRGHTLAHFSDKLLIDASGKASWTLIEAAIFEVERYRPRKGIYDILAYFRSRFDPNKKTFAKFFQSLKKTDQNKAEKKALYTFKEVESCRIALNNGEAVERGAIPIRFLQYLDPFLSHVDGDDTYKCRLDPYWCIDLVKTIKGISWRLEKSCNGKRAGRSSSLAEGINKIVVSS